MRATAGIVLALAALTRLFAGGGSETAPAGRSGETPVHNAWLRASAPGDTHGAG